MSDIKSPTKEDWIAAVVAEETTDGFEIWVEKRIREQLKALWVEKVLHNKTEDSLDKWILDNEEVYW